jgi:hypothetical protein
MIDGLMEMVLRRMRASNAGARNWPAAVSVRQAELLKGKEKTESGEEIWHYRRYDSMVG